MAKTLHPVSAKVYHGARRRYFSRASAEVSFFWAAIKRRCECEDPTMKNGWEGSSCSYHRDGNRERLDTLKARFLRVHFGRAEK